MKTGISLAWLALMVTGYGAIPPLPPGATALDPDATVIESDTARVTLGEYSVQVPAKGWLQRKVESGFMFTRRQDRLWIGYTAAFAIRPLEKAITDRKAFLAYVTQITKDLPQENNTSGGAVKIGQYRYGFQDREQGDLYVVIAKTDYERYVPRPQAPTTVIPTRTALLRAWDQRNPGQMVVVQLTWGGSNLNETEFTELANRYLRSLETGK